MAEGKYNPEIHHRRSIRIPEYDYSQEGMYYVTICTQNRECLFGEVKNGQMQLNEAGDMVQKVWNELPEKYSGVEIDAFIIMPNHIHGIALLSVGAGPRACPDAVSACPDAVSACPDAVSACPDAVSACPETNQSSRKGHPLGGCPYKLNDPIPTFPLNSKMPLSLKICNC